MLWALATSDPQGWLAVDKAQQLALITQSDQNFKSALDRYKYPNRYIADYPEKTEQQIEQTAKAEADIFLQQLERRLQQQPFLMAEHLSLVDMAVLPFIRQFAFVDKEGFDAAPYSKLQQWLANFLTSDLFTQVMPKFKQWQQSDEPLVFTN
jgi:glutathione S-transferase